MSKTHDELMAARGYLPLVLAAKRLGYHRQTLWGWVQDGKVGHERLVRRIYVEEKSLIAHVGASASRLLRVGQ